MTEGQLVAKIAKAKTEEKKAELQAQLDELRANVKKAAKAAVSDEADMMEWNGREYKIAEEENKPKQRKMYAKGTIKLKPILKRNEDEPSVYTFIFDGQNSHMEQVELFFRFNKLPLSLEELAAILENKEYIETTISYKEEHTVADSTTFEADGELLFHTTTGWRTQNIFNRTATESFEMAKGADIAQIKREVQLTVLNEQRAVLNDPNSTAQQKADAMTIIAAS